MFHLLPECDNWVKSNTWSFFLSPTERLKTKHMFWNVCFGTQTAIFIIVFFFNSRDQLNSYYIFLPPKNSQALAHPLDELSLHHFGDFQHSRSQMFPTAGAQVSTPALLARQGCCAVLRQSGPQPCPAWGGSAGTSQGMVTPHTDCALGFSICSLLHWCPIVLSHHTALLALWTNRKAFCDSAKEKFQIFYGFQVTSQKRKKGQWGRVFLNAPRCNTSHTQECVCAGQFCLYIESGCWVNPKRDFCKSHFSSPGLCTHLVAPSC